MTKPRRWRRWLIAVGVLAVLAAGGLWLVAGRQGSAELARIRGELDASDPGWRLDALLAAGDAARPPDDRNAAVLAKEVAAAAPKSFFTWPGNRRDENGWPEPPDLNRLPPPDAGCEAYAVWHESADAIALARRLRDRPRGGARLDVRPVPFDTLIPHADDARQSAALLQFDAQVSALVGDPDRAVASLHAALHAGRGLADDPFALTMLVRIACNGIVTHGLQRVLAWSEPTAGLAELQAALAEEADAPILVTALRGERACADRLYENVENGTVPLGQLITGGAPSGPAEWADAVRIRSHLKADHARALGLFTRAVEAARRPPHEWRGGMPTVPDPPERGHILSAVLTLALPRMADAAVRNVAFLRTAVVALACERFRRATGRWPESLAELPHDLLSEVPLDPYDGKPLRFRRLADGLVVYAVGENGTDDGGRLHRREGDKDVFPDVGFRLWDPAHRSAPPLPKDTDR